MWIAYKNMNKLYNYVYTGLIIVHRSVCLAAIIGQRFVCLASEWIVFLLLHFTFKKQKGFPGLGYENIVKILGALLGFVMLLDSAHYGMVGLSRNGQK